MIGQIAVMMRVFYTCGELVLKGVGPILKSGHGI